MRSLQSMHRQSRSHRIRKTTPLQACGPQEETASYPVPPMPPQACKQSRSNGTRRASRKPPLGCLQEASLGRHLQDMDASFSDHRSAPSFVLEQTSRKSLAEKAPLEHFALEGETSKLTKRHPPQQSQLDSDKLELVMQQLEALQKKVRELGTNKLPPLMPEELAENNCKPETQQQQ